MTKDELRIFAVSFAASGAMLTLERIAGIGWDYHPDSVLYATGSGEMVSALREHGIKAYFNNGFYVLSWMLGENVILVTMMNMLFFSWTNVLLFRIHSRLAPTTAAASLAIWLLLLNPYRLHLSTTMLKDSVLILLAVLGIASVRRFILLLPIIEFFRLAGILYGARHLRGKYLVLAAIAVVTIVVAFPGTLLEFLLKANEAEMVFREFDRVPTFQNFGLAGAVTRGLVWAMFAVSGAFVVVSPSASYAPVAAASLGTLVYCLAVVRTARVPLGILFGLVIFGMLATGFTAYIRYVYPLVTIWPLVLLYERVESTAPRQHGTVFRKVRPAVEWLRRAQNAVDQQTHRRSAQ